MSFLLCVFFSFYLYNVYSRQKYTTIHYNLKLVGIKTISNCRELLYDLLIPMTNHGVMLVIIMMSNQVSRWALSV